MNVWKLEWLRLVRTKRWIALLAVFVLFGFIGPLTARYLPDIISSSAGNTSNLKITVVSKPTAVDGFLEFLSNASQIGLLVIVIVAANALALDTKTSLSTFYRTRVAKVTTLILPRFTVAALASVVAFMVGVATAWYETAVLLGHVDPKPVLIGTLYLSLYWIFCVATVALAASLVRGVLATVGISLGMLLVFPIAGSIKTLGKWLPTTLPNSITTLMSHQYTATYYLKPTAVAAVLIILSLAIALARFKAREVES